MNRFTKYFSIGTLALSNLIGCQARPQPIYFEDVQSANGYDVMVWYGDNDLSSIDIGIGHVRYSEDNTLQIGKKRFESLISAFDNDDRGNEVDGLRIMVNNLPVRLKELACTSRIDDLLSELKEEQKDVFLRKEH